FCIVEGSNVGQGAQFVMAKLTNSTIGEGVTGLLTQVTASTIGDTNKLHPFSRVEDASIGGKCTLGGRVASSTWGDNVRDEHLWTNIENESMMNLGIENGDTSGKRHIAALNPPSTHGAGTVVRGTEDAPVKFSSAFFAGMGVIGKGAEVILGFAKKGLADGDSVEPFTFSTGKGRGNKKVGGVFSELSPSFILRHILSYTFKGTPKEDRWAVGYMVEFYTVQQIEALLQQLGPGRLADGINVLIELIKEDFKDMSTNASPNRAVINGKIAEVKNLIANEIQIAGITAEQKRLLSGLEALVGALDGRWRLRYDSTVDRLVFTEGKWKYYREDTVLNGRYIEAGSYEWAPRKDMVSEVTVVSEEVGKGGRIEVESATAI
ncbi:MAG: hypothetical protein NC828_03370, partial [Candidatus Omnitrophica bacterium]|nr:hypothetical protein [Candidatus Omnitrophota bacterium]